MESENIVEIRLKGVVDFFKKNYVLISYALLALVVWLAEYIRTLGLPNLKDITTGNWTLGPDLDPFLFLRWSRYIVEHGSLMDIDFMRNFPLGVNTHIDFVAHAYFMAWFHDIARYFGSTSVAQSAVLYPVFMFCLGIIFVFLFVRKVFADHVGKPAANILGILSALFTTLIPVLLPRTIAGIPDKQGTFVFFLFFSLYLFMCAWKAKKLWTQLTLAIAAGLATGIFYIVWGGGYLTSIILAPAVLVLFFLGGLDKRKVYVYLIWLAIPPIFLLDFSVRYTIFTLLMSFFQSFPIFVGLLIAFHYLIYEPYIANRIKFWPNVPGFIKSTLIVMVLGLILLLGLFGPKYVWGMFVTILGLLISPAPTDRFNLTVAQNRVPYLSELAGSFGPYIGSIPIFFTAFILGSVYMMYKALEPLQRKERISLTLSYAFMIFAVLFSRYSASSTFNGENFTSHAFYGIGMLVFVIAFIYVIRKVYKEGRQAALKEIKFDYIVLTIMFFLTLISVKGAVRLVLILVPPAAIMGSYFAVALFLDIKGKPDTGYKRFKIFFAILVALSLIYAAYVFYQQSAQTAEAYVPNLYTHQWQYAMSWVRQNTPTNAVFAHWWDYGYWVQSIGDRATVLDGGNVLTYWDFLMGRYALTGTRDKEALDFFYAHNVTNFLIDSTDIGKYAAYASIGSDQHYDRYSWIPTFMADDSQTQERKNSTLYVFSGNSALDQDITYSQNGTDVFLPASTAAIIGVLVDQPNNGSAAQPMGVYYYQNQQYILPLRYAYSNGTLTDFGSGIDAGIYEMPVIGLQNSQQLIIQPNHALFYLSPRVVHSQLARLYLFNQKDPYFKLVHSEDDILVSMLKSQHYISDNTDILVDQTPYANSRGNNIAGPIRIWNVSYPAGLVVNQTYLLRDYPDPSLIQSR